MNFKKLIASALMVMLSTFIYAQTFEASGTVIDHQGEAVIGATVMEKGTNNGTITDLDGNFKLPTKSGARLVISYIGYKTREVAAAKGMKIQMAEDETTLSEVVVTGYQVQRKVDLTGSVAVMDMKSPISESDPNMLNSMQGKLPGVDIVTDV